MKIFLSVTQIGGGCVCMHINYGNAGDSFDLQDRLSGHREDIDGKK